MKYKPLLLSPLGLIPAGFQAANAADLTLPVKAPPTVVTYTPSWAGFYAGLNLGYISAQSHVTGYYPSNFDWSYCWDGSINCTTSKLGATGVLGGAQIGYNFQSGNWVAGLEADFDLSSAKSTSSGGAYDYTIKSGISEFGTARLRLGYAFDHALIYATGGLAFAKTRDSFQGASPGYSWADVGWRTGWTVGGGLEVMINKNWSVKGEALYYDLGNKDLVSSLSNGDTYGWAIHDKMDGVVARVGLNYLFH